MCLLRVAATHGPGRDAAADGVCQREERGLPGSGPHHLLPQTPQPPPGLQPRQRGTSARVRLRWCFCVSLARVEGWRCREGNGVGV